MAEPNVQVKYKQIFIDNEWHDSTSGKTYSTVNPATGDVIVDVQAGDKADVDKAVAAARRASALGSVWRTMDASKRRDLLLKVANLIKRDLAELARLSSLEIGKLITGSQHEVAGTAEKVIYYAGFCEKVHGKTTPSGGDVFGYTRMEPMGVVGIIGPFNFPLAIVFGGVAAALAAGNTVVVKPADKTSLATLHVAVLFKEAGFPNGVVNVVTGYGSTAGAALAEHMDVDQVAFTGSLAIGRIIQMASARSNLKRVTLELGGKSPLVISQNCDLKQAVGIAQLACYMNSGQVCCAGTRIFVHEDIHDAFVEASVRAALERKLGDPFSPDTVQGPQIDQVQLDRILELIQSGVKEGATLKCGGKRFGTKGFYVEPTIFTDVSDDMRIAREEIFGPVMQILKYKTLEEAIVRCNDSSYGLAAGIVTKDLDEANQFSHAVQAGMVWVNCFYKSMGSLPFGGYKQSGIGRCGGEEGILEYMQVKSVATQMPQNNF